MEKTVGLPLAHKIDMGKFLVEVMGIRSVSEARRLISQGAVDVYQDRNSKPVRAEREMVLADGYIVRCGKNNWVQLNLPEAKVTFDVRENEAKVLSVEEA